MVAATAGYSATAPSRAEVNAFTGAGGERQFGEVGCETDNAQRFRGRGLGGTGKAAAHRQYERA